MEDLVYQGMTFEPFITRGEIQERVQRLAEEIKRDCTSDNPLFLCVLNGAFIFAADLFRACDFPTAEISFIRFKSYEGTSSTGKVKQLMGLTDDIAGRDVIIVEDIVDTGVTAVQMRKVLAERNPRSVKMASLLFKPDSLKQGTAPEYVGFSIPSKFILGYGLDIDGQARNLPDIYVLKEEK
ncbi:MAG: hypoxanthine phosphoribosyltransferase [Muribaculaceae bacterium]|nr:hypoxanthine phosphoribosyltransferase [Muribaculaceae bacterium]